MAAIPRCCVLSLVSICSFLMTGDRSLSTPISAAICSRSSRTDMKLVRSSSPASCPSIAGTKLSEIPPSPTQSSIASSTTPTASNSKERASESKSNPPPINRIAFARSEEHTSELQSHLNLVCRLLLEKKKNNQGIQSPLSDHHV